MEKQVVDRVWNLYAELGSWRKVADHYGSSKSMAWRIANEGYEPKDKAIRKKFGFTELITQKVRRNEHGRFTRRT